jgi:hypothetical protein
MGLLGWSTLCWFLAGIVTGYVVSRRGRRN